MSSGSLHKGSILVVDDNPTNLNLLTGMLIERRYLVRAATSGRRALTLIRANPPDLIMLDISMPEMDGYEVCRHLKADEATRNIPVIFISALDDVLDKIKAFDVGGVDYVTKPFHVGEVLARVESQLKLAQLKKELERKNEELRANNEELSRQKQDLLETNLKLKEIDRLKVNFTAMLVHDLRSPLSVVKTTLDLIETDELIVKSHLGTLAVTAGRSLDKILNLINEVLEVFRLDSNPISLRLKWVDLKAFLQEWCLSAQVQALSQSISFDIAIDENLPVMLVDIAKLERAFSNLLSNAIKFTPAGGTIGFSAQVRPLDDGLHSSSVVIIITDSGPGIAPQDLPYLFDLYWQAGTGKPTLGVGLGLAIVKQVVVAHGGTITVDSQVGKGSVFTVVLPVAVREESHIK